MARPRSFEEAHVLDQARAVFWNAGYAGTSMDDVMTATGLGKGSLYGAFGDKHQLFLRVFAGYCDGLLAAARQALDPADGDAADQVDGFLRRSAAGTAADIAHRGCLLAKATAELSQSDSDVITQARATFTAIEDLLTTAIERAQHDGRLTQAAPARDLARLVLATSRGIEALGKAGIYGPDLASIAETTIRLLHAGAVPSVAR
jgi:TetR/AcrR family transcriptional regulator, transcriptional repressor for nem operon